MKHQKSVFQHLFFFCVILTLLCSCGINDVTLQAATAPQGSVTPVEQPEFSIHRPFRVIQICIDTPPLYPVAYVHQALNVLADWIEADVQVNQDGFVVYSDFITSQSFSSTALAPIQVSAFPPDLPAPTPHPTPQPTPGETSYQIADAQSTVTVMDAQAHATWQQAMQRRHAVVARARVQVAQQTKKLRTLSIPYDDKAADIYGCLQNAAVHFRSSPGEHYLIIASSFVNNTSVNITSDMQLYHTHVRGIWQYCSVAPVCDMHDTTWRHTFLQLGAADVVFYDPQQSQVLAPLF